MVSEIKAVLIFEMLGRPAEHLKSTLSQFIDKLSNEDGLKVLDKKINEPKKLEQTQQELFTTFAETEIEFTDLDSLIKLIFVYMPSHVEIISPSELRMKNFEMHSLVNELIRKLHQYDEIAKSLAIERNILKKQLEQQSLPAITPVKEKKPKKPKKKRTRKKK